MSDKSKNVNTEIWEQWQKGQEYLATSGLATDIPMAVRFYQGEQWAKPTERTKSLPRPVVNVTKLICRNKQSGILATPVRLIFKTSDNERGVKYSHFVDWLQKECDQESLDKKAIKDGVQKGSYIFHYFWDKDAKGKDGKQHGAMRCEVIDPLNIIFANPCECDEQKQKYIIIATREDVDSVKAMADDGVDKDAIVPDDELVNNYGEEIKSNNLVTVLTKYYRIDGEVYWTKSTQNVIINAPQSLAPDKAEARKELGIEEDAPNSSTPDSDNMEVVEDAQAHLYPIVVGQYEECENSIYGLSEVKGIIPNQKILNNTLALYVLNVMSISFGKYIVAEDALQGQRITNEPAQILVNHSKINPANGIKKLEEQPIQSHALGLVDKFLEYTRSMTGSTEVMTGEALGKNQSGAAIAQLQMTAQQPLEDLKSRWWLNKRKQGLIYLQFIRTHYTDETIEYTFEDEVSKVDENGKEVKETVTQNDTFIANEYANIHFDVTVEASAGTKTTIVSDIAFLDAMYQSGKINAVQYVELYPDGAISNKESLLKAVKENNESIEAQLQQALATIEQLNAKIEQDADLVNKASGMVSENQQLKQQLIMLYTQANSQLLEASTHLEETQGALDESLADNQFFAETLAGQRRTPNQISPPMGE